MTREPRHTTQRFVACLGKPSLKKKKKIREIFHRWGGGGGKKKKKKKFLKVFVKSDFRAV